MTSCFQAECGCEFTKKLVVMFKDIQVSATTNEEFKRHVQATSVCDWLLAITCKTIRVVIGRKLFLRLGPRVFLLL